MLTKAIIEARMTSSRLPGKVLMPIVGKPALELLVERLRRASTLDGIVIATTTNATDDCLEELARQLGIECFRGSEDDVLDRVLQAARRTGTDVIVEVTGDCPLTDPGIVDQLVRLHRDSGRDYVANVLAHTYPRGLDVQVFATDILEQVASLTDDPVDHEHVSLYIYEHPERFSLLNLHSPFAERQYHYRITLDTETDLAVIRAIFEGLYPANPDFRSGDVIAFLDAHPEIANLNREIKQKKVR